MVIRTIYRFVDSSYILKYPQKRGLTEKEWGILEVILPESGANDLSRSRKVLPLGNQGLGETKQINNKMHLIRDSCQTRKI